MGSKKRITLSVCGLAAAATLAGGSSQAFAHAPGHIAGYAYKSESTCGVTDTGKTKYVYEYGATLWSNSGESPDGLGEEVVKQYFNVVKLIKKNGGVSKFEYTFEPGLVPATYHPDYVPGTSANWVWYQVNTVCA